MKELIKMLTKEDRAAIAKRLNSCEGNGFCKFYEAITNREAPESTTYTDDIKVMLPVVLDLCDTSNMVELPLDKDGEVIKLGDTVYSKYGTESIVDRISYHKDRVTIATHTTNEFESDVYYGWELTHKKQVTIASLVGEIRRTLSQSTISNKETISKLWEITDQIEMLGESND